MPKKKDNIFQTMNGPFEFNETVATVFDDMIHRSVPLYEETLLQQARLTKKFYREGTKIYDLGCSNGNFTAVLIREMKETPFELVAVDNSSPMLELYQRRIRAFETPAQIKTIEDDIENIDFENPSIVVSNLTLQFLSIPAREEIIRKIYNALDEGDIFLLTEKTINEKQDLMELQQEFYYRFKAENGYSQIEITRKREALENFLVPETVGDHIERLRSCGFEKVEIWLKWFHFTSFICRK